MRDWIELAKLLEGAAKVLREASRCFSSFSLQEPLCKASFSGMCWNSLRRGKIEDLGSLIEKSEDDLLSLKNFGLKSLEEVREYLRKRGLHLKGDFIDENKNN